MSVDLAVCHGCGNRFWTASWAYCRTCMALREYQQVDEEDTSRLEQAGEELDEALELEALLESTEYTAVGQGDQEPNDEQEALLAGETLTFDDGCEEEG